MSYKRISPQPVVEGGTGNNTFTAYSVITAGTTATGPFQNVVGLGTAGQLLTSAGAGALPTWTSGSPVPITITGDTGGPLVGAAFIFTGGTTGLSFDGLISTFTTTFAGITANGGTVSLATDATASTINIGTGAGVKTSTFGSTNTTSTTTIQSGSGALNVTSTNGALTINSGTGALGVSTDASATTVSLGTGAAVKGVTLGSTNSTSATTVQSGSGALNVTSTNGALTINSGTGALGISTDASATTVSLATGAAVKGVTLGSTNSTSATTVQSGSGALAVTSTNGTLTINSGTGTLGVSTDASATTINLGTGAAAKTVVLGSTNTTSTTTLQAGSGGVKLGAVAEGALVTSSTSVISTVTGTAGFVLTANAAGTAPSFQAAAAPSGVVKVVTLTLTNSQIKNLHATPIQILAAPGAGLSIIGVQQVGTLNYGGTSAFTAAASQTIVLKYTDGAGLLVSTSTDALTTALIVSTSSKFQLGGITLTNPTAITSTANKTVVVYQPIATEISGNAANDNTITISFAYMIAST